MSRHQTKSKTTQESSGLRHELPWLTPPLLAGACILFVYLESHSYPAFGAGLYFHIADYIGANGYALPETIPHYTEGGVPFAYPPLMFYVLAALRDVTGYDPFTIALYVPGLVSIAYLVPLYFISREVLGSRLQTSLAVLVVAVSPPVLQWHISAGGLVRAPAMLFALTGVYAGLRLFRDRDGRWLTPATLAFTLTILTHPVYTVFFVVSFLVLFLRFDRSIRGFRRGLVVGVGGLLLTTPWWAQVVVIHGPDVFTGAAGTHGGIGGGIPAFQESFNLPPNEMALLSIWHVIPIAGCAYLLWKRRYFLPVWLFATGLTVGNPRFVFLVGALVSVTFLIDGVVPWLRRASTRLGREEMVTFSVVLIATVGLSGGTLYAMGDVNAHAGSPSLPQFVNEGDVEAMTWVGENTDPSARFVVLGDGAEWFPQRTHRTLLVGPWGVEWQGDGEYHRQLRLFRQLSHCPNSYCLTTSMMRSNVEPDYVFVQKGQYTVRGMRNQRPDGMVASMVTSPQYSLAFENRAVAVFRVNEGWYVAGPDPNGPVPTT